MKSKGGASQVKATARTEALGWETVWCLPGAASGQDSGLRGHWGDHSEGGVCFETLTELL